MTDALRPATRDELSGLPADVAPRLLGAELRTVLGGSEVRLRLTEVEAYHGQGTGPTADPGSHARMGRTARNATMWGEPGHLYVYLSHGIHSCVNVVCGPDGQAGGVLLRAGEVVDGLDVAPSHIDLAGAEVELLKNPTGALALREAVGVVRDRYDLIVVDCPPTLGTLVVNALAAADEVIIPIEADLYALMGLRRDCEVMVG